MSALISLSNSLFQKIGRIAQCKLLNSHLNLKFTPKCSFRQIHMENHQYSDLKSNSRGALIVLEGLDRCGKTSQCNRLLSTLEGLGHSVESWRFPDRNTGVGKMISSYLSNQSQLDDHAIHLLFSANRWEKRSLMEAKLMSGTTLIVDRYSYSGVAFSTAKGLDIQWCKAPEIGLLAPDLVVYLNISPEVGSILVCEVGCILENLISFLDIQGFLLHCIWHCSNDQRMLIFESTCTDDYMKIVNY